MFNYKILVFLAFLFVFTTCKSEKDQAQSEMQVTHSQSTKSGDITYQPVTGWVKVAPNSSMRKDQYRLPGTGGAGDAELAVFVFPGSGGTVQANIDRWLDQFNQADGSSSKDKAEISVSNSNGLKITTVYVTGTYLKGAMGGPMSGGVEKLPNHARVGSIVESSSDLWFFKAVGPQATIDHWRASFNTFLQSVSQK